MRIFAFLLTFLLFIGPVILAFAGFPVEGENIGKRHLYPAFYLLFIYIIIRFIQGYFFNNKMNTYAFRMLVFVFISYFFLRFATGHRPSQMILFNSIALPALYAMFFSNLNGENVRRQVRFFLIAVFCFNCLMAVYERLILYQFFPVSSIFNYMDFSIENDMYSDIFRSNALLGHPLSNALITSVVMGFLIVSDLKIIVKYPLIMLGFVALLCFNARGAILFTAAFFIIYSILPQMELPKKVRRKKWIIGIAALLVCAYAFNYMIQHGYGGRFFEYDVDSDSSIAARLEVWKIIERYDWTFFLLGGLDVEEIAMRILGYNHIENWLILCFMSVGIIVTALAIIFFVPMFRKSLKQYTIFESIIVIGVFLCVSTTNNSLACGVPAIATFFTCAYAFSKFKDDNIEKPGDISRDDSNRLGGRKRRYTPDDIVKLRRQIMKGKIKRR